MREIEQELHEVDLEAYLRHVYQRARGLGIDEDSPSLLEGTSEVGTVLFIDLPGFTEFAQGMDPQAVLVTFNHLMADFSAVLSQHQARVVAYRGNGVMALARDIRHAERGVTAALDLVSALEEFNRPAPPAWTAAVPRARRHRLGRPAAGQRRHLREDGLHRHRRDRQPGRGACATRPSRECR